MERPAPELYQPPLTWWSHVWRLALALALTVFVSWTAVQDDWAGDRMKLWVDLFLGVVGFVLVQLRRRWPLGIALVLTVFGAFSVTAAGPGVLAVVSLATRRVWWQVVVVGVLNLVASLAYRTYAPGQSTERWWFDLIVVAVFTAAALAWGMYIGSRRELVWTLKNRAERAEAEQELRVSQARGNERARIAREMHDVLAHRISQISLHAGALGYRSDLDADELRANSSVIRDLANAALTDLRGVLGVLRDPETGELASAPQPTWADLPALVEKAREAGLHVELAERLDGGDQALPDVVGRTLYRIVQEGITNVGKHAPGAVLRIEVSGSPEDGVDIVLRNPLGFGASRNPGSGLGLIGLTERAELRGGRLEGRRDGQTFVLSGWIPWAA
ncbi:MAG: histidine kinase [Nocardioides sp.]